MTYGTSKLLYNSLIYKGLLATKLSISVGLVVAFVLLTLCIIKEKFSACSLSRTVV